MLGLGGCLVKEGVRVRRGGCVGCHVLLIIFIYLQIVDRRDDPLTPLLNQVGTTDYYTSIHSYATLETFYYEALILVGCQWGVKVELDKNPILR